MQNNDYIDIWRILHPDELRYTWRRNNPISMSRLDYFLIPQYKLDLISECSITPGFLSDHSFVEIEIQMSQSIRGQGFWKLNVAHLEEKEYIDEMNIRLDRLIDSSKDLDPGMQIELIKMEVTAYSHSYGCFKAKEYKASECERKRRLKSLEKKLACINLQSDNAVKLIEKINDKIDKIKTEQQKDTRHNIYKTQAAMIRTQARWYELGEKNSKYFFALEKNKSKNKSMKFIYNENNQIESEEKQSYRSKLNSIRDYTRAIKRCNLI